MIVQAMPYPASAGGGPFSPDDLASLEAWFDADAITATDGTTFATWPDATGHGWDGTTTNSGPTINYNTLNGLKTARFASIANGSLNLSTSLMSGATSGSYFAVFKVDNDPAASDFTSAGVLSNFSNDGTGNRATHTPYKDGNFYEHFGATARKSMGNPTKSFTSYRIYSVHSGPSDFRAYIDGDLFFTTATNTINFGSGGTVTTRCLGWAQSALGNLSILGRIAEVLIFKNDLLSTSDRQKVEGQLAHKWGLTANLDAGHPYKSVAP